jgi:hypothetical protein
MGVDAILVVQAKSPISDSYRLQVSREMASAFGTEHFWIARPTKKHPEGRHALTFRDVRSELEVSWLMRYYGPGYERGDIVIILAVAQYLKASFPLAKILYGGDSDMVLEELTAEKRTELWKHFVHVGHRPYRHGFSSFLKIQPPDCDFCKWPMFNYGGGGNREFFGCDGCGRKVETTDGINLVDRPAED